MKTLILFLFIVSASTVRADKPVSIQVMGVSFSAPDSFSYSCLDQFFHTFKGTEGEIKIHFTEKATKNPAEALQASIARAEEKAPEDKKIFVLLDRSEVTTRSGLPGVKGRFGLRNGEKNTVTVARHYFALPGGRVACVCVSGKGEENQKKLEALVLEAFRWTEKS